MLEYLGRMIDAATALLQARAALIICDLRETGRHAAARAVGVVVAVVGLMLLASAGAIVIAERLGWAASLGILGVSLIIAGVAVLTVYRSHGRTLEASRAAAEREVERTTELLKSAGNPQTGAAPASGQQPKSAVGSIFESMLNDKELLASGLFAVGSILGPMRSIRVISTLASGAGVVASAVRAWKSFNDVKSAAGGGPAPARDHGPAHSRNGSRSAGAAPVSSRR